MLHQLQCASVKIKVTRINIVTRWCLHGLCFTHIALGPHIDLHINLSVCWNHFVVKVEQRSKTDKCLEKCLMCKSDIWKHTKFKMTALMLTNGVVENAKTKSKQINSYMRVLFYVHTRKNPLLDATLARLIHSGPKHYLMQCQRFGPWWWTLCFIQHFCVCVCHSGAGSPKETVDTV